MEMYEKSFQNSNHVQAKCVDVNNLENGAYKKEKNKTDTSGIAYKLDDVPPWYLCLILGLQHYLTMFGGTVTYPYLIAPKLCLRVDDPARGYLISTTFFVCGICTFLQTTFGIRLPIVQGSTMTFLVPVLAILNLPQFQCPDISQSSNETRSFTEEEWENIWMSRMRQVQGAVIGASLFEVAIGFTGLMGILLTWITPLAIVPTISLVGLSLFAEAANSASGHWGIAMFTIILLIIFSQCLRDVNVIFPIYNSEKGWSRSRFPFFKLFPVLLTIILVWSFCAILTEANVFPKNNPARTDLRTTVLNLSPWFRFPYPGQWGIPIFSASSIFGVLAGVLASAIESVGDYYACARLSGACPPPTHAINRGICIEGIGCVLAGLWGTGGGVTSYSENIGAIGITKVASRRVIQYGAGLMIIFGMVGKFGALFVTIPEPIVGGVFCVMFSMITAVGLSTLHYIDLNSSRNLFVLGFSTFMGLCLPKWIQSNTEMIATGNEIADQILIILLSTNMFVGGFLGFLLDNIIPGSDEERGVLKWKEHESDSHNFAISSPISAYDMPLIGNGIKKISFFRFLPVSPTFESEIIKQKLINFKNCIKRTKDKTFSSPDSTTHF